MCIGEEVTGWDATDRLMDVHGCNLSWSSANPKIAKFSLPWHYSLVSEYCYDFTTGINYADGTKYSKYSLQAQSRI